jgi:NTP pyrophosphatase (non-canonical NTP hydrolase)
MEKYQKELDEFFKKNGWPYWSPLAILARLFEEGGEFARLVNHLYGDKRKKDTEKEQELEGEMGDILYTLICFANSTGIDLDKAIRRSLDKAATRDKDRFERVFVEKPKSE